MKQEKVHLSCEELDSSLSYPTEWIFVDTSMKLTKLMNKDWLFTYNI